MNNDDPGTYRSAMQSSHHVHLEKMIDYYGRTGAKYNQWHCNPDDSSSHNFAVRELLLMMQRVGGQSVLDVCCGTGRGVKAAIDRGFSATGIDISPKLLEIGRTELGIPADCLVLGDAAALPFPDNSFDVCCVFGALHHTAVPEAIVNETVRVAKKGIVISDEGNHLHGGIKHLLKRIGLFEPVYRLIFRRPPRQERRAIESEGDGPTFAFSIEEIIPIVRTHFSEFRCLTFYRIAGHQFCSYRFPRLFARQGVLSVSGKIASSKAERGA